MIKDFLAYYRPYKSHFIFVVLGSCVAALLDLIFPILVRHILNVELPQKNVEGIMCSCQVERKRWQQLRCYFPFRI